MRLSEALTILKNHSALEGGPFRAFLACSFTPLHLQTFLVARLRLALPQRPIEMQTGLYGDLLGSLERLKSGSLDSAIILLEWVDLDPRLGLRSLGGWRLMDFSDILNFAQARLAHIENAIASICQNCPVVLCLPTLPLPPLQVFPVWKAGLLDLQLREFLYSFAVRLTKNQSVKLVSPDYLDCISPPGDRFDVKGEISNGFPYKLPHADAVAKLLTHLIQGSTPKKGLITDLDHTLWKGILGDIGTREISWSLDHKSHMHGLYQELLRSLASTGALLAVASKNDPAQVEEAFDRQDLILGREFIFPFQVHWGPKSGSVARILEAWNISADSVVFVDDSPTELAEVQAAHPEIECLQFPTDPHGVYHLITRLRNLFAKDSVSGEDAIRLRSIRNTHRLRSESHTFGQTPDAFLKQAESELIFSMTKMPWDPRVLELINKTNQFNLNGVRYTEHDLRRLLSRPHSFVLKASYQDKFGPLGKIAILLGRVDGQTVYVDSWVMSCRAFSRRIEHECLGHLFKIFGADQIQFEFVATQRNKPLQEFFAELLGAPPETGLYISKKLFFDKRPRSYHRVQEEVNG